MSPLVILWVGVTLAGAVWTLLNLLDAIADRAAVRRLNGKAPRTVAKNSVRREVVRLVMFGALLIAAAPFLPREVRIGGLIVVPFGLSLNSWLDRVERKALARVSRAEIDAERERRQR